MDVLMSGLFIILVLLTFGLVHLCGHLGGGKQ